MKTRNFTLNLKMNWSLMKYELFTLPILLLYAGCMILEMSW